MDDATLGTFVFAGLVGTLLTLIGWYMIVYESTQCARLDCVRKLLLPWGPLAYRNPRSAGADFGLVLYILGVLLLGLALCTAIIAPLTLLILEVLGVRDFAIFVSAGAFLILLAVGGKIFVRRQAV